MKRFPSCLKIKSNRNAAYTVFLKFVSSYNLSYMNLKLSAIVVFTFLFFGVSAQKIKYKDLFPTLSAKNYSQGGPSLKIFINDPKNAEHANAHLQMGLMLESEFYAIDVAQDTDKLYEKADSAEFYFRKSIDLVTEKELKKNDEYYQAFFRRDLRTGEFGIKQSDVHLDIEKKVENIRKRVEDTKGLNSKVAQVEKGMSDASSKYKELADEYSSYNQMLLAAGQSTLTKLEELKTIAASTQSLAIDVKKIATSLGTTKYIGDVQVKEIREFGVDGLESTSLSGGKVALWDYENWAIDATSEINGSVGLFKSMVTNYSNDIRDKKKSIKNGTDVEIDTLSQDMLSLFSKYDPESVVEKLLKVEASEVRIMKYSDFSINKVLQDSSQVGGQLDLFTKILAEAEDMDLVLASINNQDLEDAKTTFEDYINSFFQKYGTAGNFVSQMKTWAGRQKGWAKEAVDYWTERNRWGILTIEGEADKKVPLYVQDAPESEFFTLGVPIKNNEEAIVYGANLTEKKGFIYAVDQGRYVKWNLEYDLPGDGSYKLKTDTVVAAEGSANFYILNEDVAENNLSVVSYTNEGVLNWNALLTITKDPIDFKFDDITQELTILFYPEEELPLDDENELGYLVIDRTGNVR